MKSSGVCINEKLEWTFHVNEISQKPVKANAMLCKIRHFVNETILQSKYHSHLLYACTVCGQDINQNHQLSKLQREAVRIISFEDFNANSNPLFYNLKIRNDSNGLYFN